MQQILESVEDINQNVFEYWKNYTVICKFDELL